jgi:tetratricopeptide (TPR) repeat protein
VAGTNYPQYSVPLYNTALAFSPNDIGILMDRATTLHNLGRTSDAVASLDRIEMIDPNNTAPVVMKGDILFQDGQYEESIGYFEKALSMNRNNAQVWIREGDANLALSIIEMGKIRKQYQNLTSEYNQPSAATDASTMDAFRSTESYQEAVKDYNEAIRIDPFTSVEISGRILSSTQSLLTTYQGILDDINQQNVSAGSGKPS